MEGKGQKITALALALLLCAGLSAQNKTEQKDSLVRLIKAKSLELIDKGGGSYRKTIDATFFHNNTYFICDTALWNVDSRIINAWGNVRVVQEGTILTSDKMDYHIDDDLIQARGTLVQLEDKDHNTLRTHFLDYNTKDSIAYFSRGAAMKDKDGQIIESSDGSYDAKLGFFQFQTNVNMFTDSVFIRSSRINYESRQSRAIFPERIDFWKDDNMLSADRGWYERLEETFFFNGRVHAMSKEQEAWCDSLYYYRTPNNILMQGKVQVQDTTRNAFALSNELFYEDSLRRVTLRREAAVALQTEDKITDVNGNQRTKIDTIYIGADKLVYFTQRKCDIPEEVVKESETRLEEMFSDPVTEYRRKALKAAEEAAKKAAEENQDSNPLLAGKSGKSGKDGKGGLFGKRKSAVDEEAPEAPPEEPEAAPEEPEPTVIPDGPTVIPSAAKESIDTLLTPLSPADSIAKAAMDSLAKARADSIHIADSLANIPPPDTTRIGFAVGVGNVKVFRTDIQVLCDSLRFTELDSVARFYIEPKVWNDGNRQYTADSIGVLVNSAGLDRASLMSNAFIITQETETLFDQIRATEVMAYFDTTSALRRFDAMGGANAIFYLKEKEEFATVNKVDCKMLSAHFADGELQQIHYFESPKNDAYPLAQLPKADREMRGFKWMPELKPQGKEDITDLTVRMTQRKEYEARPKTSFKQTDRYFPGYMKKVYAAIEASKNKPKARRAPTVEAVESEVSDSSALLRNPVRENAPESDTSVTDTVALSDTTVIPSAAKESGESGNPVSDVPDSLATSDTLAIRDTIPPRTLTEKELRDQQRREKAAQRRAEKKAKAEAREAKYQAKVAAREARWAVADSIDAAKAAVKAQKQLERKQAHEEKVKQKQLKQKEADDRKLEKYIERYRKKYAKKQERKRRQEEKAKAKAQKSATEEPAEPDQPAESEQPTEADQIINDTDGKDPGQIPEVRPSGHPEQRRIGEPALDRQAIEPVEAPVQGVERPGSTSDA